MSSKNEEIRENEAISVASGTHPIEKGTGVTNTERYLQSLADKTFHSMWSYPNVRRRDRSNCKEVCDLLVVFEDHVIIFSDKENEYKPHSDPKVAWRRWYKKAIDKSARQIFGAEEKIRKDPSNLYLDKDCSQRFPIPLPPPDRIKVHRIIVANGAAEACKTFFGGGKGSLMIAPRMNGDDHLLEDDTIVVNGTEMPNPALPFMVGEVNPNKGYVHVLDEANLGIVLQTLSTVRDFVEYLERKERFVLSGKLSVASSEEDLLAYYLQDVGADGWNDFMLPENVDFLVVPEGGWDTFQGHPQRRAQLDADRISYAWDKLTERFNINILNDTQYETTGHEVADSEKIVRFLAREPRTRRRMLSGSFLDLHTKLGKQAWKVRVIEPSFPDDPHYIFMVMRYPEEISYEEYRQVRRQTLEEYMMVLKAIRPEVQDIVGIAVGPSQNENSEDLLYIDASLWTEEQQAAAQTIQEETGYLSDIKEFKDLVKTYPDVQNREPPNSRSPSGNQKYSERNRPCPCGSGKKFKHCHGRK